MASDDSGISEWLFDSIVGFLKSPMWKNPIQSFIDENCIVFDNEEENKFSYTLLHQQVRFFFKHNLIIIKFRDMIDGILEMHLAEMGITPEQVPLYFY